MDNAESSNHLVANGANTPSVPSPGKETYALTSDLHVRGNEIYLPQTRSVDPESPGYLEIFTQALPDDVAREVKPALIQSRAQYSLLTVILCAFFLVMTAFLVYYFMPRPRVETLTNEIARGDEANHFGLERNYRKGYDQAKALFQKEEFDSAIATLEPTVEALVGAKQSVKDNRELFYLYFSTAKNSLPAYPNAADLITKVQKNDPDSTVWRLFKLWFNAPECRNFGYRQIGAEPNLARAEELRTLLAETATVESNAAPDRQDAQFDFYRAQLLYSIWLYQGNLEYDSADPGVKEREEAYRITSRYMDNEKFLELRRDIVRKILDSLPWSEGYFYFDGQVHWRKDALREAENEVQARLDGSKVQP